MKNTFKQKFAFLLAVTMLLSSLPATAFAKSDDWTEAELPEVSGWWKDRSEPNGWEETGAAGADGDGYITVTNSNDGEWNNEGQFPSDWYRWEGRKVDTYADFTNHWVVETSLNVTEEMLEQPADQYSASLWVRVDGTTIEEDQNGHISGDANLDWAILYFSVNEDGDAVWKSWNGSEGDWVNDPVEVTVGEEQNIKIEYLNGTITQSINDEVIREYKLDDKYGHGYISAPTSLIIQSYDFGGKAEGGVTENTAEYSATWKIPSVSYVERYDWDTTFVEDADELKDAVETAEDGDIIALAAGNYDVGTLNINNAVSLIGADAEDTTIKGAVVYQGDFSEHPNVELSNITFEAPSWDSSQGVNIRASGAEFGVTNCIFDGWQYGLTANSKLNQTTTINVDDTQFNNTWCAMSVAFAADRNNSLVIGDNVETTNGAFALQLFGADDANKNLDYHFYDVNEAADALNDAENIDEVAVEGLNVETQEEHGYGQLKGYVLDENDSIQDAIDKIGDAQDGIIVLNSGTYEGDIIIDKSITLKGAEKAGSELTGKVTINGANLDVTLDGLKFTHHEDTSTSNNQSVISAVTDNCENTNLTVKNCVAENLGYSMFMFTMQNTGTSPRMGKITVANNKVSGTEGNYTAFNLWGAGEHEITGNVVENIGLGAFNLNDTVGNVVFTQNNIKNVGGNGFQIATSATGDTITVEDNTFEDVKEGTSAVYFWGDGATIESSVAISGNEITGNGEGINFGSATVSGSVDVTGNTQNGESVGVTGENVDLITATFKDGGVSIYTETKNPDESGSITVACPKIDPKVGYEFEGWKDDKGTIHNGDEVTISTDTTFTAVWDRISSGGASHPEAGSSSSSSSSDRYEIEKPSDVENGSIKVSDSKAEKGDIITITVTPDEGYELDELVVYDEDGDEIDLEDEGDGEYTFEMPEGDVEIEVSFVAIADEAPKADFADVAADAWYADAVQYVFENGMMSGTSETTFSPNLTTTRGMIVTILYRLENEPAVTGAAAFTDVAADQYYANAVAWAAQNGIVAGIDATTFAPNNAITREQMAAILYRYAQFKGYDVSAKADLTAYTDAASVGTYATDAMAWANGAELITGTSTTTLSPAGNAIRAQVAAILMRFCENVAK